MKYSLTLVILSLLIPFTANAKALPDVQSQDRLRAKKKIEAQRALAAKRRAARNPKSLTSSSATTRRPIDPKKALRTNVGLVMGFSSANSAGRSDAVGRAVGFGLSTDVLWKRFLGAEFEGFYAFGGSQDVTLFSNTATKQKINQYGAMANLKFQYPIRSGTVVISPKLGGGYGAVGEVSFTDLNGDLAEDRANSLLDGFYGLVGFEANIASFVTVLLDYAKSINASGRIKNNIANVDSVSNASDSSFDRIRFGAFIPMSDNLSLGGQLIRRSYSLSLTSGQKEVNHLQTLATVQFNF